MIFENSAVSKKFEIFFSKKNVCAKSTQKMFWNVEKCDNFFFDFFWEGPLFIFWGKQKKFENSTFEAAKHRTTIAQTLVRRRALSFLLISRILR